MVEPFTFERVKEHTGKVQYRTNGAAVVNVAGRKIRRAEVVAFKSADFTAGLVAGGDFAHVPADTPVGVPALASEPADPSPAAPSVIPPVVPPVVEEV